MIDGSARRAAGVIHPLHAILLAFPATMFTAAFLADWAYASSFQVQWTNFASWLIVGGLLFGALALVWALVDLLRIGRPAILYFGILGLALLIGFFNALVHARDAWAAMPAGFILSAVSAILALVAAWIGYSGIGRGDAR